VSPPDPGDFEERLRKVASGGTARFNQMRLSPHNIESIVAAARGTDGHSVLVDAAFDGSIFEDRATFSGVRFEGNAGFSGTLFTGEARFNGVQFIGNARFDGAVFSGPVTFGGAEFGAGCWFAGVEFKDDANFNGGKTVGYTVFDGASFAGNTLFMRRTFQGPASFDSEARFESSVRFDEAKWMGGVSFSGTRFSGETRFFGAAFSQDCSFEAATFGRDCNFAAATFECRKVLLDDVAFPDRLVIAGNADWFSCKRTRFLNGANVRLDGAAADLTEAEFARPSALSGRGLRILSMKDAYVRDLGLAGADLTRCRFVGAQSLDELSMGDSIFASSPAGWSWSARDVILEECLWRVHIQSRQAWQAAAESIFEGRFANERIPDARQIAVVYRELRKGKEDSKDEPGAAGFYYGEMEMRRHASRPDTGGVTSTLGFWAERSVLWAYWLVSGYALRASRALIALLVTIVACSGLLYWFGFSPRPAFPQAILLSAESSSSLLRPLQTSKYLLTSGGEIVDIALRLFGPLFLGLFLLSLRGRVRR
jgi:uncharacterized protein YjbI with pentapeptide repeats